MDSTVEYFYHGELRWTFGFDSPNKAAVLFACLLPLLWSFFSAAWNIQPERRGVKVCVLLALSTLIIADTFCLFKTYSRGGVWAAVAAECYMLAHVDWIWKPSHWGRALHSTKTLSNLGLTGMILGLFLWTGLGERSVEPVTTGDASVGHRLILWRSALQMAVENPDGFGTGKSGSAYMQWYQPVDATTGYRTMVNSYLTFLVEQGWLWFSAILLSIALFWFWASPGARGSVGSDMVAGLRASILAFLGCGIFSTVMEEPTLWIIPASCALTLAGWSLVTPLPMTWPRIAMAIGLTTLLLSSLYVGGLIQAASDPIRRKFADGPDGRTVSELALKQNISSSKIWIVVPDDEILGPYYGKLLRKVVSEAAVTLKLGAADLRGPADRLLLVGKADKTAPMVSSATTILLCPAQVSEEDAKAWSRSTPRLLLLTSAIDEDQRGNSWQAALSAVKASNIELITLKGVGLRVDWAWTQVIDIIKNS